MQAPANSETVEAVFINLDRATERRRFMERQADRLGLRPDRFAAVEASALAQDVVEARGRGWQRPLTRAELGCFLSHEALWRRVADGDSPVLVMEDDVVLSARLIEMIELVPGLRGIEFLNIESCDRRRFVAARRDELSARLAVRRVFRDKSGSGAYVLWPSGAKKLLQRAARIGAEPVDAFLHGTRELVSFQAEPALAMQLHILEARGVEVPISSATFIQAPREGLPLTRENLGFHKRRLMAQMRLGVDHVWRLGGRRYRPTEVVESDFVAALADGELAELADGETTFPASPSRQSLS